ncbi:hypothetical protein BKA70DRAFT_1243217 [Coprinopsis sp. MPI-PUGE-AT-0042]|nr:hypothetical protein BKA70DRAFT_1243217 [Coprinopsis sp. MPI-PUGE-AT-0042]
MGLLIALNQLVKSAPLQMACLMPAIVPVLAEAIWDTKADIKKAAWDSLTKATALVYGSPPLSWLQREAYCHRAIVKIMAKLVDLHITVRWEELGQANRVISKEEKMTMKDGAVIVIDTSVTQGNPPSEGGCI